MIRKITPTCLKKYLIMINVKTCVPSKTMFKSSLYLKGFQKNGLKIENFGIGQFLGKKGFIDCSQRIS